MRHDILVTAAALARALASERPPLVLAVRAAETRAPLPFATSLRIPGAFESSLEDDFAAPSDTRRGSRPLPDPAVLAAALCGWGAQPDTRIVVYDHDGGLIAARAWWVLRWAGLDARLLDGGFQAWARAGLQTVDRPPPVRPPGKVALLPGHMPVFEAEAAMPLARQGVLIDSRIQENYVGAATPPGAARRGHIPGAVSLPALANLDEAGCFLDPVSLRTAYAAVGVREGRAVGVYCGAGVSSAHDVLALATLGIEAAMYPGSWSAWIADPSRPAAIGPQPGASFDFDAAPDRLHSDARKWTRYPPAVTPLWVADADFAVAPAITEALAERARHPVFGYAAPWDSLREAIVTDLAERHGWAVAPEQIVMLPGVEPGFNMALRAFVAPGDTVAVQTPAYRPILAAPGNWGMQRRDLPLTAGATRWEMNAERLRGAMAGTRALLFCNPHNPTGKVFDRAELALVAETCLASDTLIISDEIHCDLLFDGRRHLPIATLDEAVARRSITLMSAGKTYNIAGLKTAFAIIPDAGLRATFEAARAGMVDSVNTFGLAATEAAYRHGGPWRDAMMRYLCQNRNLLAEAVRDRLPGVAMLPPEGTFLAWLDCRTADLLTSPYDFFLERAGVALSDGREFGAEGEGFVRLNLGCTRATLAAALTRMSESLGGNDRLRAC